jgi:hypothetical protein
MDYGRFWKWLFGIEVGQATRGTPLEIDTSRSLNLLAVRHLQTPVTLLSDEQLLTESAGVLELTKRYHHRKLKNLNKIQ